MEIRNHSRSLYNPRVCPLSSRFGEGVLGKEAVHRLHWYLYHVPQAMLICFFFS